MPLFPVAIYILLTVCTVEVKFMAEKTDIR